jgi:DNA repair protein RadC
MSHKSGKHQTVKNWPLKERPRERLIHCGAHSLSDSELLAISLRTGVEGCSVVDLSRNLLNDAGSLRSLLAMPQSEFVKLRGMGDAKYAQLQACLELSKRVLQESLSRDVSFFGSEQTKAFLTLKLRDKPHEVFAALFLDSKHQLICFQELFRGTINGASVSIREVIKDAMQYNAASIVVAHNHPSGVAEPSIADKKLTKSLAQALALVDVKLLDHIVVGDGECWSFAERGLL